MREWFLSSELIQLDTMPSSIAGISQKAKRENWKSRKAKGGGRSLEFHLTNFKPQVQYQLYCKEHGPTDIKDWKIEITKFILDTDMLSKEEKGKGDNLESSTSVQHDFYFQESLQEAIKIKISKILEFNVQAATEAGSLVSSEHAIGHYIIPTQSLTELDLKEEDTAIIFCSGDSMEPLMSDGDRIIVDTREQATPVKNGIYIIRIDDAVYVKRLKWNILEHSYTVESENKAHDDFELAGDNLARLRVIGKAKLVMKSL